MGWSSGGDLADNLWRDIEDLIPKKNRKEVAQLFIENFESYDCDVMEETVLWKVAGMKGEN